MSEIKILHKATKETPFFIIYKSRGLPSAPLNIEDKYNAYSMLEKDYPELSKVIGKKEIEHGLVHRIDTETEGVLLIAATQDFYDYIQEEQKAGRFIKYYDAVCDKNIENTAILTGFPEIAVDVKENKPVFVESYFRSFGIGNKEVRPVTDSCSKIILKKVGKLKKYSTEVNLIKIDDKYHFQCKIAEGYRHQVRCHLAWLGFPIVGDKLYNGSEETDNISKMYFKASKIEFNYKGKLYSIGFDQ